MRKNKNYSAPLAEALELETAQVIAASADMDVTDPFDGSQELDWTV